MCSPSLLSNRAITKMGRSKEHSHYSRRVQCELKKNKQMSNACCITVSPMRFNRTIVPLRQTSPPRSAKQHLYRPFTNPLISVTFVWNEETTGSIQRGSLNKDVYIWHTVCDKYRMKANLNPWRRNRKISKMFVCRCGRILLLWQQTLHGQLCRWLSDRQKLAVVSMAM